MHPNLPHNLDTQGRVRIGNWQQTRSGQQFWPLDPRADEILIDDIAHSLANQCRWAGHCEPFYSVAEHSVRVSQWVEANVEDSNQETRCNAILWGLLHDASEAYCVDVPRPLKRCLAGYEEIEERLEYCIGERFSMLTRCPPAIVKRGDEVLLATELRDLMGPTPAPWSIEQGAGVAPLPDPIDPWGPAEARSRFIRRFRVLDAARRELAR